MGAQAHDVLDKPLIVCFGLRLIAGVLQAPAAELAVGIVDHHAVAFGGMTLAVQHGAGKYRTGVISFELVMAHADPPAGYELIDSLRVPAVGRGRIRRRAAAIWGKVTLILALQVFRLKLEISAVRIAIGRPFPDKISDYHFTGTGK